MRQRKEEQQARKEAEREAKERAKREAEEAKRAKEAEAEARKEAEREAKERAKREAEKARKAKEAEAEAKEEAEKAQKAVRGIESEVYGKNIQLVIPMAAGFKQVAKFKEHLEGVEDLTIVMTGGSVDEGSIIVVSAQKPIKLVRILHEMPMVASVHAKGETIVINLKTPSVSEEGTST
jgi:hypothetical protein